MLEVSQVVEAVASKYDVEPWRLRCRERGAQLDEAKSIAYLLLRVHGDPRQSWQKLAEAMNARIFHTPRKAVKTAMKRIRDNPRIACKVRELEQELGVQSCVDLVLAMRDADG